MARFAQRVPTGKPVPEGGRVRLKSVVLVVVGSVFLVVGGIGVVLPVLPTFPFLAAALACYASGSARFAAAFQRSGLYVRHVEPLLLTRSMTAPSKAKTLVALTVSLSVCAYFVPLALKILVAAVAVAHYVFLLFFIKTLPKDQLAQRVRAAKSAQNKQSDEKVSPLPTDQHSHKK